jgi:hypothetical protein
MGLAIILRGSCTARCKSGANNRATSPGEAWSRARRARPMIGAFAASLEEKLRLAGVYYERVPRGAWEG